MKAKDVMKEIVAVSADDTLSKVVGLMKTEKKSIVFVMNGKKCSGIIRVSDLLNSRFDGNQKASHIAWSVPIVEEDTELEEVAELMFSSSTHKLPVTDGINIIGSVSAGQVLGQISKFGDLGSKKAKDLVNNELQNVKENDTLGKVIDILIHGDLDRVAVVDDSGKVIDLISGVDILETVMIPVNREVGGKAGLQSKAHEGDKLKFSERLVSEFSRHRPIIEASPNLTLPEIVKLMNEHKTSSIILTEEGDYAGIVIKRDLLGEIANLKIKEVKNIQFIGLNDLKGKVSNYTINHVKRLCSMYGGKINYLLNQTPDIKVHFKSLSNEGKQHKYDINVQVSAGSQGQIFTSNKALDWDLSRTVHKAFHDVKRQIEHKLKVSSN